MAQPGANNTNGMENWGEPMTITVPPQMADMIRRVAAHRGLKTALKALKEAKKGSGGKKPKGQWKGKKKGKGKGRFGSKKRGNKEGKPFVCNEAQAFGPMPGGLHPHPHHFQHPHGANHQMPPHPMNPEQMFPGPGMPGHFFPGMQPHFAGMPPPFPGMHPPPHHFRGSRRHGRRHGHRGGARRRRAAASAERQGVAVSSNVAVVAESGGPEKDVAGGNGVVLSSNTERQTFNMGPFEVEATLVTKNRAVPKESSEAEKQDSQSQEQNEAKAQKPEVDEEAALGASSSSSSEDEYEEDGGVADEEIPEWMKRHMANRQGAAPTPVPELPQWLSGIVDAVLNESAQAQVNEAANERGSAEIPKETQKKARKALKKQIKKEQKDFKRNHATTKRLSRKQRQFGNEPEMKLLKDMFEMAMQQFLPPGPPQFNPQVIPRVPPSNAQARQGNEGPANSGAGAEVSGEDGLPRAEEDHQEKGSPKEENADVKKMI